jgi:hypothetical protein
VDAQARLETPAGGAVPGVVDLPRPPADELMRRLLRISDRTTCDLAGARNAFSASVGVSAVRCLLTYIVLPLLKPVIDLSGGVGPVVGLLIGAVSTTAIIVSMRRFWAADHRLRWGYTAIGAAILAFLAVQAVIDLAALV